MRKADRVPADLEEGLVVRQDAKACVVRRSDGSTMRCAVRGRVHLDGRTTATTTVAVGDRVRVREAKDGEGVIEGVLPRTSVLARPEPDRGRRRNVLFQHVLAANVDAVAAVSAAAEPAFSPSFVDRLLAAAEWSRLGAVVIVNKVDLVAAEPPEVGAYRRMGYRVVLASARTGRGIDEVREVLSARTTVVAGHSGVGKSSLLNAVSPGLALDAGAVNPVTGRGTQTTTASVLVSLAGGGAVIDTPGVREFGLYNVPVREVTRLFRDLAAVAPSCRFSDCSHRTEPGCAVPAAIEAGRVSPWRFESYLRCLDSLSDAGSARVPKAR
jgi:ribosome biogenesis GTPase